MFLVMFSVSHVMVVVVAAPAPVSGLGASHTLATAGAAHTCDSLGPGHMF